MTSRSTVVGFVLLAALLAAVPLSAQNEYELRLFMLFLVYAMIALGLILGAWLEGHADRARGQDAVRPDHLRADARGPVLGRLAGEVRVGAVSEGPARRGPDSQHRRQTYQRPETSQDV